MGEWEPWGSYCSVNNITVAFWPLSRYVKCSQSRQCNQKIKFRHKILTTSDGTLTPLAVQSETLKVSSENT